MQYPARVKYFFVVLGLLGSSIAAPERVKRQESAADRATRLCQQVFNVRCDSLSTTSRSTLISTSPLATSTFAPPALNTDLPRIIEPDCVCVPYFQCSPNTISVSPGTPVTPGNPVTPGIPVTPGTPGISRPPGSDRIDIDRRLGETCSESLDVCCPRSSIITDNNTNVPTPTPPTPQAQQRGCGFRNPGGVSVRITGNDNGSQFAEFPWMIVVLSRGTAGNYECGGSLIHPRVVLTAAHTIEKYLGRPGDLLVRAGEWDASSRSEPIVHQEREVEAIILHENYNTDNLNNDFALLILRTEFILAPSVNTICLPQESDIFDSTRCTATGWGKDTFESQGRFQAVLKKIELPVVPRSPCQTSLRSTRLTNNFNLHQSFICAGGEPGKDTCTGDGGSPLVCPLRNTQDRYVQAGIVSWGIGCGQNRVPGVYASVAKARRWIDSKLASYNLDISSYVA